MTDDERSPTDSPPGNSYPTASPPEEAHPDASPSEESHPNASNPKESHLNASLDSPLAGWRPPEPGETEVMLLGTYHMNNDPEGPNINTLDPDDVLVPERQSELRDLADRLAAYEPDRIAIEAPRERQSDVDDEYERYRAGEELATLDEREEHVQVGFRLADRLDLDRVDAVDHHVFYREYPDGYGEAFVAWREREVTLDELVDHPVPDREARADADQQRLEASTIPEFLAYLNDEPPLGSGSMPVRYALLGWDDPDGVRYLARWQERNLRIVHNVRRAIEGDDERVLLLVGAGHLRDLRHYLNHTPGVRPVSPLPYLPDPG